MPSLHYQLTVLVCNVILSHCKQGPACPLETSKELICLHDEATKFSTNHINTRQGSLQFSFIFQTRNDGSHSPFCAEVENTQHIICHMCLGIFLEKNREKWHDLDWKILVLGVGMEICLLNNSNAYLMNILESCGRHQHCHANE
jgi:hypothetical protein